MRVYFNILSQVVLVAAIPFILFWLGVGLSYLFFPNNFEYSSWTITVLTFAGCLVGMFITIHNIRYYGKQIWERKKNDSHLNS